MKKNIDLFNELNNKILSEEFKENNKVNRVSFTRERKMSFSKLIYFLINIVKRSLQIEINDFFELLEEDNMEYSKQAFSKARRKLLPKAFKELNETIIEGKYQDDTLKKYKGYRLLAIDGSVLELPFTKELELEYGKIKSNSKKLKMVVGRTSMLYDIENNLIIDGILNKHASSERVMAEDHLNYYLELKNRINDKVKDIVLFDRGYPSLYLITFLLNRNIDFVMRITNSFLKETNEIVLNEDLNDEIFEINITKSKLQNSIRSKKLRKEVSLGDKIKLRLVKVKLSSGETEYLVTSLKDKESFKSESFKEIYFKRWGIETAYDKLKNSLEIENFTGIKSIIIKQDFNISILINNICSLISEDAQNEIDEEMKSKNSKYEYKVNRNIVLGLVKNRFIKLLFEPDSEAMNRAYLNIVKKAKKNKIPIRDGRSFSREIIHKRKFNITRKRPI